MDVDVRKIVIGGSVVQTPEDMGVLEGTVHQMGREMSGCWPGTPTGPDAEHASAHTRLEDLARVVDSLPTSKLWASDPLCVLPASCPRVVSLPDSTGPWETSQKCVPKRSAKPLTTRPLSYPARISKLEKQDQNLL